MFSRIQRAIGDWHTHLKSYSIAPSWETTEYRFDPKYGDYESTHIERCVFEDGTFAVTTELVDRRNRRVTSDCD